MATQVAMPEQRQKENSLGKILQLGGAVAGGIAGSAGGPMGAIQGAGAGAALGGAAGGLLAGNNQTAVQRRMGLQTSQGQNVPQAPDPMSAINEARTALVSAPPELQQEYAPALQAAMLQARRQQGVV